MWTISWIWNGKTYSERYDSWVAASSRYWFLIAAGKNPTMHSRV